MYLKKIIAHGFKSFADNTIIDLENSIIGIVGPNGSGKSNVVDAIRWVLGEQSVKSLRGDGAMTDVIFAGSKSRNPMNVATINLIFDNHDHYLPISYDEVSIKRRLYKDGTNEYYLNSEKCRLKDIQDILMDTGIAKESFNIISQGKIEEILSSKPTERRIIFEEAAGVLKYKKRKEEALRKLERTNANMDRVNDIIKELEVQVEPLKEQKRIALEYIDLEDQLKRLEIALIVDDINKINVTYKQNKQKIEELTNEITGISTNNSSNEAKIENYKRDITSCQMKISQLQKFLLDSTANVEKINSRKQIVLERKKYEFDNTKLHDNLINLKEKQLDLTNEIDDNQRQIDIHKEKLTDINCTVEELEDEIKALKNNRSKLEFNLNTIVRKNSNLTSEIEALNTSIENNNTLPYAVKNILNNPKLLGIHSTIGQIMEIDEKYSKAISVVLGANINNVIVDNEIRAKEAISYLKNNNIGRVTFFPLNVIKEKNVDNEVLTIVNNNKEKMMIASQLVKYDAKYTNIIKNQLGNVIVVSNVDIALKLSKAINYRYRIVTLDGELFHVGGSLTGGNIKTKNIIVEKQELELKLQEQNNVVAQIKNIENEINELDFNLKSREDKLYLTTKEQITLDEIIKNKMNSINDLKNKLDSINNDIIGTENIIDNKLSDEEQNIIEEYYQAINKKNAITVELDTCNNTLNKLNSELEEFEYSVKKDNSLYNQKNNELKMLEIEVNRSDVKLDTLLNALNENYTMTFEKAASMYKLDIDATIARNKVNNLKRQIKELGPVNLNAPEEYDRISERYEFLIKQQHDLSEAENTLLSIIEEMDDVMKNEFLKTFKDIQENFSTTFKELFKGGKAELVLTDNNNLLETGIEIVASPPGKSLKSISLLSGGEKTFTAISLLFAILKSRPMPFCILDEVEAALDEVNVDAFGEYLTKLKEKTQFIVITHKKKTMEYADILYGITMQESGVSKLVSVKLEDIEVK
ncbi:MAG: chromosome segregation protein SMC [Bacilli bacterium]|nr:chromosome segregation protein SMC [Bacilli bacterium]